MAAVIRVTGAWVGLLMDWLDREGLEAKALRVAVERWSSEETVPVPVWRNLLDQAVELAPGHLAPELAIGRGVMPGHVGALGYLALASDTLGEAMLAYQRYENLFYGVNLAQVSVEGSEVEIRWPREGNELGQRADGVGIAALVTFMRRQLDNPPPPSSISFMEGVAPGAAMAYEQFFECPVRWHDSHVRVRFPVSYLTQPMLSRDPALRVLLDRQAQALVRALPSDSAMDRQLQQVLLRLLAEGEPTLARASAAMHMSPRTLQRRLAGHGLSWQQWLDRSREQLASQYLQDPALSLSDVALLLGFSEQSAFTRAFRRWTATSPGRFRQSVRPLRSPAR
ncbi:helix-turn-helix domain-containing protein [Marinobacter zhejiangensis]|uniref:AraC-type DNA-binding protein n=1 Tax=Marinobacter zhejiangensis TaxID=488535 RepID=A0A1I4L323_9GAMM|nr:AraC family transcriptional regulator [Marinobacter zhejiangensis]SFL85276.1 AraC-type DNA-binding protein [Marinobacter zhejiangensis]